MSLLKQLHLIDPAYASEAERLVCEQHLAARDQRLLALTRAGSLALGVISPIFGAYFFKAPMLLTVMIVSHVALLIMLVYWQRVAALLSMSEAAYCYLVNSLCFATWIFILHQEVFHGSDLTPIMIFIIAQAVCWLLQLPYHGRLLDASAGILATAIFISTYGHQDRGFWFLFAASGIALASSANRWVFRDQKAKEQKNYRHRQQNLRMMAHDMRRPIQTVKYLTDLLALESDPQRIALRLQEVKPGLGQSSSVLEDLLREMLDGGEEKKRKAAQITSINAALKTSLKFITAKPSYDVNFCFDLAHHQQIQIAEPTFMRLTLNLIENALQAMHYRGTISIKSRVEEAGPVKPVKMVELKFHNTNSYIDAATLKRIFLPGFTTKGESGSGLGLAIVQQIAHAHGGDIGAESSPTAGTTFILTLPAAAIKETMDAPKDFSIDNRNNRETLKNENALSCVIVDDDPFVHTAWCDLNPQATIYSFLCPSDFWAACQENPTMLDSVALVITDYLFGGFDDVDGLEFASSLKSRVNIPIYLSTLYEFSQQELKFIDRTIAKEPQDLRALAVPLSS